ncbi:hypothetical protein SAMN05444141_109159 [Pseudovibrio denitrificans]|uniref:HTH HARE-type domain-containing protein n=2 Tax=Pseudovibrio denitrificans TaxID=258256 RepID=A0A1I7DM82_9HYPH|nr:hypothetical protein [Pseudovibrio denitrificans]SFU12780.1 hypothetical protein SAMN05444141_109159 [Pseudovibrio denitrificans]
MDILECVQEVMTTSGAGMHVKEIASEILKKYPNMPFGHDELATRLSTRLSSHIQKKKGSDCRFSKVSNGKGGERRGVYRLKKTRKAPVLSTQISTDVGRNFVGKGGEHAVLSELLFRGYNAAIMTVDQGIDVVASKDGHYFHIQVKTARQSNGGFQFSVNLNSFNSNDKSHTFYIFLCRQVVKGVLTNVFIVFPSSMIINYLESGVVTGRETLSFNIRCGDNSYVLNGKEKIDHFINKFELIK